MKKLFILIIVSLLTLFFIKIIGNLPIIIMVYTAILITTLHLKKNLLFIGVLIPFLMLLLIIFLFIIAPPSTLKWHLYIIFIISPVLSIHSICVFFRKTFTLKKSLLYSFIYVISISSVIYIQYRYFKISYFMSDF